MRYTVLLLAATLSGVAPLPTAAQVNLNMNQVTCGDWLALSPEGQNFVRYWMSGYYNAAESSDVLNYERLQRNSAKVLAYCKKHKPDSLPTAIKKSAS